MPLLNKKYRWLFLGAVVFLTLTGIAFVYSAGTYWGKVHYGNSAPFLFRQLIYLVVAVLVFIGTTNSHKIRTKKFWDIMYILSLVLLVAVLIPGIGAERNGSQSWIVFGPVSLQPAEFAKISLLVKLSFMLAENKKKKQSAIKLSHFLVILLPITLIMLQPDFGSTFLMIVSSFALFFVAGYPLKFYFVLLVGGIAGLAGLVISAPYRLQRIEAYLDPWKYPLESGFQAIQSMLAIGPAGLFGHGFGNSRQKYLYLPEPQNDFIFSIIAEETGLFGAMIIIAGFVLFLYAGYGLAIRSENLAYFYSIAALVSMIGFQAFLNIGVVTGLLPVTGVTLPFISYGGSSLVATWFTVGLVISFCKKNE